MLSPPICWGRPVVQVMDVAEQTIAMLIATALQLYIVYVIF